ncbi:hypothetical protein Y032_0029g1957 [Ancylostoma ceylanicum]|uniref:Uncharacterized protein n=1 Tax=Ancylostoma ceylanicum TaxID=53326 RepID=A0A016USV8_9BILA|nr:hypothetical protein Y032_0029g1957 [Ancylostoma ceylanicum]
MSVLLEIRSVLRSCPVLLYAPEGNIGYWLAETKHLSSSRSQEGSMTTTTCNSVGSLRRHLLSQILTILPILHRPDPIVLKGIHPNPDAHMLDHNKYALQQIEKTGQRGCDWLRMVRGDDADLGDGADLPAVGRMPKPHPIRLVKRRNVEPKRQ